MKIITGGGCFVSQGAIVPTKDELNTMLHVMVLERDKVLDGNGNQYGRMTIEEFDICINQLKQYQRERGD